METAEPSMQQDRYVQHVGQVIAVVLVVRASGREGKKRAGVTICRLQSCHHRNDLVLSLAGVRVPWRNWTILSPDKGL